MPVLEDRAPTLGGKKYVCPNCGTYARQRWTSVSYVAAPHNYVNFQELRRVDCDACDDFQLWLDGRLIVPDRPPVPLPNPDLSDDIRRDYLEAASILGRSPRGATALLRLALQKLCMQLGEKGQSVNDDIASLVKKGLPVRIQQALDVLRVVGNNAVHPGQLDLRDDVPTATSLFNLINLIANDRISEPKRIEAMYSALPSGARAAIESRDGAEG